MSEEDNYNFQPICLRINCVLNLETFKDDHLRQKGKLLKILTTYGKSKGHKYTRKDLIPCFRMVMRTLFYASNLDC